MAHLIHANDLPGSDTSRQFEGYLHLGANLSFFINETPPGHGPSLHRHQYAEVFVIQSGTLTFIVGDEEIEVSGGQIVVVPPGTPHKFTNTGQEIARHIDIHDNDRFVNDWLED